MGNNIILKLQIIFLLSIVTLGCSPKSESIAQTELTSTPQGIEIVEIHEERTVPFNITQEKTFDQCESASPFKAEISFSQSTGQESQQKLILGANVSGEVGLSPVAKVNIGAAVESHFSNSQTESQGHAERVSIEVPPNSQQQYTIIWQESRREGSVEFIENGEAKTVNYSYLIGIEFLSSTVVDLECPGMEVSFSTLVPTHTPYPTYTPQPTYTPLPTPQIILTPTPQLIPTEIVLAESDSFLAVGEWWDENNIGVRVKSVEIETYGSIKIDVELTNNTGQNLIFQWSQSRNFKLFDNTNFTYIEQGVIGSDSTNENITPGDTVHLKYYPYGFTTAWIGDRVFENSVSDLYFTINELAYITEATWHIPIK